jgi:hypothetical protein
MANFHIRIRNACRYGQNRAFPTPDQPSEATLDYCPDDYQTVSRVATPRKPPALPSTISSHKGGHREGGLTKKLRNYLLWTTILGGQTPYYSTVSAFLTLPPLPILTTTSAISPLPTSTIINVIYAMSYPVNPISLDTRRKSRRWCRNRCSCYCDAIHHCSILLKKKRSEDLKPS